MFKQILLVLTSLQAASCLNNGLALTPPMGWMSWSRFYCETNCTALPNACINEDLYKQHADRLYKDGFKDVGYTHIHIDDCWSEMERDPKTNRLVADHKRFSSGIPAGRLCSQHFEEIDAQTLADWNIDYFKFDGCYSSVPDLRENYPLFYKYLNKTGKPIVFSCEWPLYEHEVGETSDYKKISSTCNLFRNHGDVSNSWNSVLSIVDYYVQNQDTFIPYNGPGSWFDPDMLIIGNGLTVQESRTQLGVWAIWSSPLIMSNDLRVLTKDLRDILQTKAVIAVDQDPLGLMGKMVKAIKDVYVFVKPMTPFIGQNDTKNPRSYSFAILCMNKGNSSQSVTFKFNDLDLKNENGYGFVDLWSGKDLGTKKPDDTYTLTVDPHDSPMFKATIISGAPKSFFKGKTVVISGASRGIGLAIGLKLARDGAKIAIFAKTAQENPKLPGTIYTAAKEIGKVGGQCLPVQCDIRDEVNVADAVKETVKKFGGIDILVNNASAVSPTMTLDTDMKRYDLMQSVNTRGTFLLSKSCIPHLKKGNNPHILNLSPPLDMDKQWFAPHVAYTISKFGMSMNVLGMAGEFKARSHCC
ncbi:Alpha-galactosidase [Aphelenchoides bicaudatus]|nr:Alpha-galactosidase [Aphelenchoides bicaudatus]